MVAADVGTTFHLGPYTVRIALRHDNPAFARYLVFKRDRLIGKQFSRPSLTDCRWLETMRRYGEAREYIPLELTRGIYLPGSNRRYKGLRNMKLVHEDDVPDIEDSTA